MIRGELEAFHGEMKRFCEPLPRPILMPDAAFSPPHAPSLVENFSIVKMFLEKFFEDFECFENQVTRLRKISK
jgi:hypothetical protein